MQTAESIMDAFAKAQPRQCAHADAMGRFRLCRLHGCGRRAEPWISVNPNHDAINAAAEVNDPDSVYAF